jgi:hypothetical protein
MRARTDRILTEAGRPPGQTALIIQAKRHGRARHDETFSRLPSYLPGASTCQGRPVPYEPWQDSAFVCVAIPVVVIAVALMLRWFF